MAESKWVATFSGWILPLKDSGLIVSEPKGPFVIEVYPDHWGEKHIVWKARTSPTNQCIGNRFYRTSDEARSTVQTLFRKMIEPWHELKWSTEEEAALDRCDKEIRSVRSLPEDCPEGIGTAMADADWHDEKTLIEQAKRTAESQQEDDSLPWEE